MFLLNLFLQNVTWYIHVTPKVASNMQIISECLKGLQKFQRTIKSLMPNVRKK